MELIIFILGSLFFIIRLIISKCNDLHFDRDIETKRESELLIREMLVDVSLESETKDLFDRWAKKEESKMLEAYKLIRGDLEDIFGKNIDYEEFKMKVPMWGEWMRYLYMSKKGKMTNDSYTYGFHISAKHNGCIQLRFISHIEDNLNSANGVNDFRFAVKTGHNNDIWSPFFNIIELTNKNNRKYDDVAYKWRAWM